MNTGNRNPNWKKPKSFIGYAIIQFVLMLPLFKPYFLNMMNRSGEFHFYDSAYYVAGSVYEPNSEGIVFLLIIAFVLWLVAASIFNYVLQVTNANKFLTFKAKIFYLITLLVALIIVNTGFVFEFLASNLITLELYTEDKNIFLGVIYVMSFLNLPFIINGILTVVTIYPLRQFFYTQENLKTKSTYELIKEEFDNFISEHGELSVPFFEDLVINDTSDIPDSFKEAIGMAINLDNNDVIPLKYETLRNNPKSRKKYFYKVDNETREQILHEQVQYYDNQFQTLPLYEHFEKLYKDTTPEEMTNEVRSLIRLYNGDIDISGLEEMIPELNRAMRRLYNYSRLMLLTTKNLHKRLNQDFKGISIGNQGEKMVNHELSRRSFNVHNMAGLNIFNGEYNVEFDNVLISKRGIFVLEVKNVGSNANSDHKIVVSRDGRYQYFKNGKEQISNARTPIQQNNEHRDSLMKYLYQLTGREFPVIPFVVYANDNIGIDNQSSHIIMRPNMILTQHDLYPEVLSEEDINLIKNLLEMGAKEAQTFEIFDYISYAKDNLSHLLDDNIFNILVDSNNDAADILKTFAELLLI